MNFGFAGMDDSNTVKTVEKALGLIELIAEQHQSVGVNEVARMSGLSPATAFRLLTTLSKHGYLKQDNVTRKYQLGVKFAWLGSIVIESLRLRKLARDILVQLRDHTQETVHLMVMEENEGIYVDKVESEKAIRLVSRIGRVGPLHSTAVGKAILANMPNDEVRRIVTEKGLERFTERTIVSLEALLLELEKTRSRGYSIDDGEGVADGRCVGAPVFDERGKVIGAISVSGPSFRVTWDKMATLGESVAEAAYKISQAMGYSMDPTRMHGN